jgi:hypothetical protein
MFVCGIGSFVQSELCENVSKAVIDCSIIEFIVVSYL